MKARVFQLMFVERGGTYFPRDPHLHKLAVDFAERELAQQINFTDYRNVFVECLVDENGTPVQVEGISTLQMVPDIGVFRSTNARSAKLLIDRMRDYLCDNGAQGGKVFVYIADNEAPEQRCPHYLEWLEAMKAKPAERYVATV